MYKDKYELSVLVNGKNLREYYHQNRFYVEAREGSEYTLKLKNHSHKKLLAIVSIDGVDVIKSKAAIDAESGYIVQPYSTLNINGYRLNNDAVAAFKFDDGKKSYATEVEKEFDAKDIEKVRKGKSAPSKNNGVIGVRIYEEKESTFIPAWKQPTYSNKSSFYNYYPPDAINLFCVSGSIPSNILFSGGAIGGGVIRNRVIYSSNALYVGSSPSTGCWSYQPINTRSANESTSSINCCASNTQDYFESEKSNYQPTFEVGTTWGSKVEDKVIKTIFNRAETYIDLEIFYLKREELVKMGIDLNNAKKVFVSGFAEAFGEKDEYCKKPIDWK